jgi:uncharacterized protein (TIGR03437 family)
MQVAWGSNEGGPAAQGSLMGANALFGASFGTTTAVVSDANWGTSMGGTSVTVTDANGTSRSAQMFYVSPSTVGYRLPSDTATGFATVTINGGGTSTNGYLNVVSVYPTAFPANSDGLAWGSILRVRDGSQTYEHEFLTDANGNNTMVPVDLGPAGDIVYLVLDATGMEKAGTVTAKIGGVNATVASFGADIYPGVQIVKMQIPRELAGAGKVSVVVTADNKPSSPVYIWIN